MTDTATAAGKADYAFGQIAIRESFASMQQVRECLEIQSRLRSIGIEPKRLGEILVEKGYLTVEQATAVNRIQQAGPPARPPAPVETAGGDATALAPATPAAPAPPARAPEKTPSATNIFKIPGYELLQKIGQGAMGTVYKARQVSMDRLVAVKLLAPKAGKDRSFVERFLREARAVAKLNHENVIGGIDVGEANGIHYFVMEFVDGEPVSQILKRDLRLDEKRCIQIALQIARALEHAERHSLVHRDVKPENIMITKDGVAKLCDLGLAKQTKQEGANLTLDGISVGTPNYISPEQARGEDVDIRTDIYSLGASLYHMVTGTCPFDGPNPMVIMTKHVTDYPDPPKKRYAQVTEGFNNLILKMMMKRREDRHQNAGQLASDLEQILRGGTVAAPSRPSTRVSTRRTEAPKTETRHETPIRLHHHSKRSSGAPYIAIAAVVLVLVVGGIILFGGKDGAGADPDRNGAKTDTDRKDPEPPPGAITEEKYKSDVETYQKYCRTMMDTMGADWIQSILARGEQYKKEYERTTWETEWIKLLEVSRGDIAALVTERVWKSIKADVEKARAEKKFAEALRLLRQLEPEYVEFTDQKRVMTEVETDLATSFMDDKVAVSKAESPDQAYRLLAEMLVRYGDDKAPELQGLRTKTLRGEIDAVLGDAITPARHGRAQDRLKGLRDAHAADARFLDELVRLGDEIKKRNADAIKDATAKAPAVYKAEVLPDVEKAFGARDLAAARRHLHEFFFGDKHAYVQAVVFEGISVDAGVLKALLDPQRATVADSRAFQTVETGAKDALAQNKTAALDFFMDVRALVLLEGLVDLALRGAELQLKDPSKFSNFSPALKGIVEARVPPRKPGDGWRISARRTTTEEEIPFAPKSDKAATEGDLASLARRAAPTEIYLPLRLGLLYLYAKQLVEAISWLEQVKDPARWGIDRYLDIVKNVSSPAKEKDAKAKFKQAKDLLFKKNDKEGALKVLKDLRDNYSNTAYMTTDIDENGDKMKETRLQVVLDWIGDLDKNAPKDPKDVKKGKGNPSDLFKGTVKFNGTRADATYDFATGDLTADFNTVDWMAAIQVTAEAKAVRLKGSGLWYWKAPLKGNVAVEITLRSAADQGLGAAIHLQGTQQGYLGVADFRGEGLFNRIPRGTNIMRFPLNGPQDYQRFMLSQGGQSADIRKDTDYVIRFTKDARNLSLLVNGKEVVNGSSDDYASGFAGIVLAGSEATVMKLRIVGEVDKDWLDQELQRTEEQGK